MRETFYACTFDSLSERRLAHVRAWDAGEAMELFVAELEGDGVAEPGDVEVAPLGGRPCSRARYRPRGDISTLQ
ncbi:hypothetical protein [Anaeromyxobacter oryzae]|uniref:Uncharacterized protein n=1 Tax=Anaeromyxobacter oryzae TaxID=2918170 RepID=A0ABN6MSQ5_9BACT|nr:hypothetical protein [Anaeromyxobacter oryzae]BDG04010.1 hypothetical protein AMOR_30060 [Anaeromyxobacter oryzae]